MYMYVILAWVTLNSASWLFYGMSTTDQEEEALLAYSVFGIIDLIISDNWLLRIPCEIIWFAVYLILAFFTGPFFACHELVQRYRRKRPTAVN